MAMQNTFSMVAAKTETFEGRQNAPIPLGLTVAERSELEWFFCGYEADVGARSTFRETVELVSGARGAKEWMRVRSSMSSRPFEDTLPDQIDRGVLRRGRAVYHALRATPSHHAAVLWLLHGPKRKSDLHSVFGDVAPIVHLTDAVESVREQMAARDGEERYERVSSQMDESQAEARAWLVHDFWDFAGKLMALERRISERLSKPACDTERGRRITEGLEARAVAWHTAMGQLLRAYEYDGTASAQATAMGSADLELTPQAAIRWRLNFHGACLPNGKPHPEALKAHNEAKKLFISSARRQAERMRIAASVAYRAARKSGSS